MSSAKAFIAPTHHADFSTELMAVRFPNFGRSNVDPTPPPAFSGFGHAYGSNESIPNQTPPRANFFNAGAQRAKALLMRGKERAFMLRERLRLNRNQNDYERQQTISNLQKQEQIVQTAELLMLAKEKANQLREILKERSDRSELEILQLQVELKKQEQECRELKKQLSCIRGEFENYKNTFQQEKLALQQMVNVRQDEISAVMGEAQELIDLLDQLIEI